MEWDLIWIVLGLIFGTGTGLAVGIRTDAGPWACFWAGAGVFAVTGICVAVAYGIFLDRYDTWKKNCCQGYHPWYEWHQCREDHEACLRIYNTDDFCKIRLDALIDYFRVNPDRYILQYGHVVMLDDACRSVMTLLVPKRDRFRYYKFRKEWLESRRMVEAIGYVQRDIEKTREAARAQIDSALSDMKSRFGEMGGES